MIMIDNHIAAGVHDADAAAFQAADFIRHHGLGLYELFELLGEDEGQQATLEVIRESDKGMPVAGVLARDLRNVRLALEAVALYQLDRLVVEGLASFDVYGATRWYGARVSDLSARLG